MKIVLAFKKKKELRNSLFYKAEFLGGTLNIVLFILIPYLIFFIHFRVFLKTVDINLSFILHLSYNGTSLDY